MTTTGFRYPISYTDALKSPEKFAQLMEERDRAIEDYLSARAVAGTIKDFQSSIRNSTDITVSSTSWIPVDTALDLTLIATAGDRILVTVSAGWQDNSSPTNLGDLDVAVMSGSTAIRSLSTGLSGGGYPSGIGYHSFQSLSQFLGQYGNAALPFIMKVLPGDVTNGTTKLQLITIVNGGSKILFASSGRPLWFQAINLG